MFRNENSIAALETFECWDYLLEESAQTHHQVDFRRKLDHDGNWPLASLNSFISTFFSGFWALRIAILQDFGSIDLSVRAVLSAAAIMANALKEEKKMWSMAGWKCKYFHGNILTKRWSKNSNKLVSCWIETSSAQEPKVIISGPKGSSSIAWWNVSKHAIHSVCRSAFQAAAKK